MEDNGKKDIKNNGEDEYSDDISIEQIKELFFDIIELPEEQFLTYAATGKGCHNARC